jgi:hypothetical protein
VCAFCSIFPEQLGRLAFAGRFESQLPRIRCCAADRSPRHINVSAPLFLMSFTGAEELQMNSFFFSILADFRHEESFHFAIDPVQMQMPI